MPSHPMRLGAKPLENRQWNTKGASPVLSPLPHRVLHVPRSSARSSAEGFSVNARCLDQATIVSMTVEPFDGRHWEASAASLAHLSADT